MGLLSGLEKFGFKSLDNMEVYEEDKKKEEKESKKTLSEMSESDMLFDKSYTCPVCGREFKVKTMKVGKAKLLRQDIDLRTIYQQIDPLKYGAVLCEKCGYAALTNYFANLSDPQIGLIKQEITAKYESKGSSDKDIYTYDDALEIHKMALLNAVVKRAKSSEKAYICLKSAWLLRGKAELLKSEKKDTPEELESVKAEELQYLEEAYKGFTSAIETERTSQICGMDIATVSYLCAALAYEIGNYEESQKMISRIYSMNGVNKRMKDKCIDLKELIQEKMHS